MIRSCIALLILSILPFLPSITAATSISVNDIQLDGFTCIGSDYPLQNQNDFPFIHLYEYLSGDLTVRCEIVFPSTVHPDGLSTLVLCHGGINGVTGRMRVKAGELADRGFMVVMPTYRGEDGSDGEVEVAAGEVDDVLALVNLLRNLSIVDPDRIALIGSSHGALIAALAASRDPEIPVVVGAYGVMDIVGWWYYLQDSDQYEEDALSKRIYGGGPLDHPDEFALRSALRVACDIEPPILIIQGKDDTLVPPSQAEALVSAFQACGKSNYSYNLYPGVGHGFLWWNGNNSGFRSESAIETSICAWDDIMAFIDEWWHCCPK